MIFTLAEQKVSPSTSTTTQGTALTERSKSDSEPVVDGNSSSSSPSQPGFTESNHWLSIIEDIKDIRAQLSPANADSATHSSSLGASSHGPKAGSDASSPANASDLGLRHIGLVSIDDVLKGLPARELCDFWVSHYFQARFTTLREYISLGVEETII